ncbi:YhgE/Pip domain-containing protein [Gorillibacterium timonense]|uniref:YhgE/Pip domain-containing protein n=1 Tax=Gorillibacterium timonense TaxID=1689269 RepID=UPI00071C6F94|nr:YhgE/Pip domain-containing protein [Gorillibacterium timonense]
MRRILSIYRNDLRNLGKSPAAIVMLLGLAFLPSLYAWFNIEAAWDPYGNTQGIRVAVVNEDSGAEILGQPVRLGDEIVSSLQNNHQIGWIFTTEEKALSGVHHGEYYASLIIPEAFSRDISSVLTKEPVKAEIMYYVNEKINAIAPKITSKGASGIIEEVSSTFVQTASEALFRMFNTLGVELARELPVIEKTKTLVFRLEDMLPEIHTAIDTAGSDLDKASGIVGKAQKALPVANDILGNGETFAAEAAKVVERSRDVLAAAKPYIRQDLTVIRETADSVKATASLLADAAAEPKLVDDTLAAVIKKLEGAASLTQGVRDWFAGLDRFAAGGASTGGTSAFHTELASLDQLTSRIQGERTLLGEIQDSRKQGKAIAAAVLDKLSDRAGEVSQISGSLADRFDSDIVPKVSSAFDRADKTIAETRSLLNEAVAALPDIQKILQDAASGVAFGTRELAEVRKAFPTVEEKLHGIADRIRAFEQRGDIQEIIDLLVNDFEKKSDFFAHPVSLVENKLYPIPNYGSAMSPFFTTLSLWVGALLLVSLLSVEVQDCPGGCREYEVYFGRYLIFLQTALLQALFVTLGDIYLLKAYVHDPLWFVLFALLLSSVFMLIVYTLVSVFGNVGKAMAIVLLVLQLAGSGGTFPIQVTPPFFQAIYPYLPFTYGISMMREATGGILWDIVQLDFLRMAVYAGVALLLGLALKAPINRASSSLVRQAKRSKLIH